MAVKDVCADVRMRSSFTPLCDACAFGFGMDTTSCRLHVDRAATTVEGLGLGATRRLCGEGRAESSCAARLPDAEAREGSRAAHLEGRAGVSSSGWPTRNSDAGQGGCGGHDCALDPARASPPVGPKSGPGSP